MYDALHLYEIVTIFGVVNVLFMIAQINVNVTVKKRIDNDVRRLESLEHKIDLLEAENRRKDVPKR